MRPATEEPTLCTTDGEPLRDALERAGLRYTRQRAAVYNYLRSVNTHPTAEEVCAAVRHSLPKVSLATVYKALEALVECGLAAKLTSSDGPARYDCRTDDHYHLRCATTGLVLDLAVPFDPHLLDKLDPTLVDSLRGQGFLVTGYRLEVIGQCQPNV